MGFYLRSRELDAISTIADVLAAPLAFDGVQTWAFDAGERLRALLGGEAVILFGSGLAAPGAWSADLDPTIRQRFADYLIPSQPVLHSFDEQWDATLARRRAARLDAYTMTDVRATLRGIRLEDLPIYQEVAEPSRMVHACGIASASESYETHLVVLSSRDDRWRFADDSREVVRLLLPAFRAGCGLLARAHMSDGDVRSPPGSLPDATVVFDREGKRLLDSSRALTRLAEVTGAGELLADAIRGTARAAAASDRTRPETGIGRSRTSMRRIRLPAADVEIIATQLGDEHGRAGNVVLVTVHSTASCLPSRTTLVERSSLTPREADVALLLARGFSRSRIAETLGLSAHTVRHHTEGVFRKLGVTTRSAVAVALLRGGNG